MNLMNEDAAQQPQAPEQEQSHQVVSSQEKQGMSKFTKIAIIAGAIVILVILAEVGYLLFNQNTGLLTRPARQNQAGQPAQRQFQLPATPTPLSNLQQSEGTINFGQAQSFIANLETLSNKNKAEFIEEASTSFTLTGRVVDTNSQTTVEGHPYILVLRSQLGKEVTLYFTANEINNSRILVETQDQAREISFEEIRANDILQITEKRNLLDTSSNLGLIFKITR